MPGNIRVAVLEVVDLPASITAAGKPVAVKVAVGKKEFQTPPADAQDGRTQPWNSEFLFPVLNLRDNLIVAIMDSKGDTVARAELETPGIVQKGFQDEFIALKAGGRIHVKVSFVLSEEERRKIDAMRVAALRRKKGFSQPNKPRQAPVSNVKITEITSEDAGELEAGTKSSAKVNEERNLEEEDVKKPEIPPPVKEMVAEDLKEMIDAPLASEKKPERAPEPDAAWKPSFPLRVEKLDRRRDAPAEKRKPSQPPVARNPSEKQGEEDPRSNKPKSQGLQWLSGKLRAEQPKASETGRWLEDLKLKNKSDKSKATKAARADEWLKKLDKQLPAGDGGRKPSGPPESRFKDEGLKRHLQEEENKLKTLTQKTQAQDTTEAHRTVTQKLEEWKLKELGPWRRSSKVQHASPPDSDQQQVARWSLKGAQKQTTKLEKAMASSGNVTIDQPELMAAADRMWASSQYSELESSPSMSPESRRKNSGSVRGFVKQVLSGAAAIAGSLGLWSRKGPSSSKTKKKERVHVVRDGETLSSIVPDEWDNPESEFYRLNPQVRDMHFIYPGQRLRLRG